MHLTKNGTSQVWVTDHDAVGHFGVSPTTDFRLYGMQQHQTVEMLVLMMMKLHLQNWRQ